MRALLLSIALLLAPDGALAQAAPLIEKAQKELENLEYANAAKVLEAALKIPGNDRATLLKILELEAITFATTGQDAKCAKAFHALLSLAPDFKLVGNYPPRVSTAYYEALGWLDSNRPLEARLLDPVASPGKLTSVRVEVVSDPLKLVKEVRFHLLLEGKPVDLDVPASKPVTAAPLDAPRVDWWAELLGERKAVLAQVGSAAALRSDVAPAIAAPPAPAQPPVAVVTPAPVAEPAPKPVTSGGGMTTTRVASIVIVGAGVASAAVGVFFGVSSNDTTAQFNGAATDGENRVTGITRTQALALASEQRLQATLANVLGAAGIALAAGGVVLFAVGGDSARVSLVPAGPGAALVGTFP